jgi:hypothetical protein
VHWGVVIIESTLRTILKTGFNPSMLINCISDFIRDVEAKEEAKRQRRQRKREGPTAPVLVYKRPEPPDAPTTT